MNKIKIGIIFGSRSGEHEVSIISAESVMKALDKEKYEVIPISIGKDGLWVTEDPIQALKQGTKGQGSRLIPEEVLNQCDVVFPVLHGSFGEDGTVQGMLEMANIAYVGAGVLGSAVGMDKVIQKELCAQANLPIVSYVWFLSKEWKKDRQKIIGLVEDKLNYPVFTKPANLGSSVGINKAHNQAELIEGIAEAVKFDRKVIVEQGIEDFHEIEVAVLGNDEPQASVAGEVFASNEFYDYDAKYVDGKSETKISADLPADIVKKIQEIAIKAFKTLDLSGMARADFMVTKKDHQIYFNEVNTIPGFTSISMYPKLWEASGLSYPKLLDKLIELAIERHEEKNSLQTSYKPKEDWYK